ncbi:uncharacterized protein BO72DRAFT_494401 [Aspergillus fijiensis CBS 313.89]|uniref:Uncharacterized protein n=1 Tax=Aspergillus fijiensis CBS 313.89 TaxID=1448319 RepID=A0A8G1RTN4_9EURO|nr:uncharacterized protein BO72DRAFT_494401 [Aspergillus fijiensis CBS 313.89]RAK79044.1 hypothetical protein BO72DRAFT_494401 [Aspergillus fijiensis CBS 313.89]
MEAGRNIYLDGTEILEQLPSDCTIYTDVLALSKAGVTISAGKNTALEIYARVITAEAPVTLDMCLKGTQGTGIVICAAVVDQPISVSVDGGQLTPLALGADSGYQATEISFEDGIPSVSYLDDLDESDTTDVYQAFLDTQLRVALALFWAQPAIAISICAYVAQLTCTGTEHSLFNAQAVSLGQQLAGHTLAGPDANYAPTLPFQTYHDTMVDQLSAAKNFEEQYQRFQDKESAVEDQKQAWGTMLQNAQDQRADACNTTTECAKHVDDDNGELSDKQKAFEEGLQAWKNAQVLKAVFGILTSLFEFAFGIASVCLAANPAQDVKEVEDSIDVVEETEEGAKEALEKVSPRIESLVDSAKQLSKLPDGDVVDIPGSADISGSDGTDADSSLIQSLAAWDDWQLECDQQMEWAADDQKIGGASEYRLALRKHAVHGRALAQAQVEAIKQGQQYDLLDAYNGEEEVYAAAAAKFYDRWLQLRTSLAIQMQYMTDAYRFYALKESNVVVDSQGLVADFQEALAELQGAMQEVDEEYANGFQGDDLFPLSFSFADELASDFGQTLIAGLTSSEQGNSGTFTLVVTPGADLHEGVDNFAYPFVGSSHYRLDGMEVILANVKPVPEAVHHGSAVVSLKIETSGTYTDLQGDQVFYFVRLPQKVRYSYEIDADGNFLQARDFVVFTAADHAQPSPFTQWTITVESPQDLDLSACDGLQINWTGHYRAYTSAPVAENSSQRKD